MLSLSLSLSQLLQQERGECTLGKVGWKQSHGASLFLVTGWLGKPTHRPFPPCLLEFCLGGRQQTLNVYFLDERAVQNVYWILSGQFCSRPNPLLVLFFFFHRWVIRVENVLWPFLFLLCFFVCFGAKRRRWTSGASEPKALSRLVLLKSVCVHACVCVSVFVGGAGVKSCKNLGELLVYQDVRQLSST